MTATDVFELGGAILLSTGGAAAVLFGLSSFLGRIWADRLMTQTRLSYDRELTRISTEANSLLRLLDHELDTAKQKTLRGFYDKLSMYRAAIDLISKVLADYDQWSITGQQLTADQFKQFNQARIQIYGYLAMVAPQSVMDTHDRMTDYLMLVGGGKEGYEWKKVRTLGLALLNEMRADLGLGQEFISYSGAG